MNTFGAGEFKEPDLFDESGILPVQFYQAGAIGTKNAPIRRLTTAILVDAIHCYQAGSRSAWKHQNAAEARSWMFGYYTEFPFSFPNACTELGISPDRIRERLFLDD